MIPIYYKSSEGVVINLIETPYRMLTDTDLLNWEWTYETVGANYPYATAFKNQMVSHSFNLRVSGNSEADFLNNLEHFVEVVDRDARLNQKGKIYFGDYYIECLIVGCSKDKVYKKTYTKLQLKVLAEDGDWKNNQFQTYSGLSGGVWINKYSIPIVSSSEQNFSYGEPTKEEASFRIPSDIEVSRNLNGCETFTFISVDHNVDYRFDPNGNYSTVTPSDCPLEIDTSSYDLDAKIYMKSISTTLIHWSIEPDEDATMIDWTNEPNDIEPIFTIDLGLPTQIESITGLDIGKGSNYFSGSECYLKISEDGINWTQIDSCEIPSATGVYETLGNTWSSSYPTVRYIRVMSSLVNVSPLFAPFCLRTKSFKVKARFTGEEQNLATSVMVSSAPSNIQTYTITDENIVELYRKFNSIGYPITMTFTLPTTTTIVAINNLVIENNDSVSRTLDILDENDNIIDSCVVSANSTANYSWSGEEEVSQIKFSMQSSNVVVTSSDFEILEKQTQAPHRYLLNDNYCPSDAIIKIYGATSSPSITIGSNQYGGENFNISSTQWLEINTKDETMVLTDGEGTENVFYHRLEKSFEPIDVGTQEILWSGNLQVDIELLNARSDPKWN